MSPEGEMYSGRGNSKDNSYKAKKSMVYGSNENRLLQMKFREQRASVLR